MFEVIKWKFLFLLVALQTATLSPAVAENFEFIIGDVMMLHLQRSYFFSEQDALPSDPIRYIASDIHKPDLPEWLTFLQRGANDDAFLYGSPRSQDDTTSLEVVAVNERTYQTAYKVYNVTVRPAEQDLNKLNIVEIWILNMNIEEMMRGRHVEVLMQKVGRMWKSASDLRLVKVMSIAMVTGRIPVPLEPGAIIKDGVILQVGAFEDFSKNLKNVQQQVNDSRCNVPDTRGVKVDDDRRFTPSYVVDWCNFKLTEGAADAHEEDMPYILSEDVPWSPRSAGIERRDLFLEFILTVLVPLGLALLIFIVLSAIMFGRREGREKRDRETSETQLMQYNSIRQATSNLRYMSTQREVLPCVTPRLGRTPAGTPGPSAVNTLNRPDKILAQSTTPPSQAPPPYRSPPAFPTEGAAAWNTDTDPGTRGTSNGHAKDDQQLMPQGSPETLKVRK